MFNLIAELVEQQLRVKSMCADLEGCFDDDEWEREEFNLCQKYEAQIYSCFYCNLYSLI